MYFAARQRLPDFMSESPFDGRVARRMKMAANVIDKFRYINERVTVVWWLSGSVLNL